MIDHRHAGDTVRIDLRQRYTGDLPAAALAMIDPDKLSWVEQLEFDLRTSSAASVLVPDHYADRFSCSGRYTFADDAGRGTVRALSGDVKVRVLLVGGKVEGALVSGLREHAGRRSRAGGRAARLAPERAQRARRSRSASSRCALSSANRLKSMAMNRPSASAQSRWVPSGSAA